MNGGRFRPGRIALYLFLVAGLVFMVAPIAIVVVESFNSSAFGQWPPPGFSTMWYGRLFHGGGFGAADDPQPRARPRMRPRCRSSLGRPRASRSRATGFPAAGPRRASSPRR